MDTYFTTVRGALPDREIINLCEKHDMIKPFVEYKVDAVCPSYGLSSYGYDITLNNIFKTYKENRSLFSAYDVLRPGEVKEEDFDVHEIVHDNDAFILLPGGFCLAESKEYFKMPSNVIGRVCDKSTYARLAVAAQNTVLEPGWYGTLTLELTNHGSRSIALIPHRGIVQVMFEGCEPCLHDYGANGKYQNQSGPQIPK